MMNKILLDGNCFTLTSDINEIEVRGKGILYINNLDKDIDLRIFLNDYSEIEINDFNVSNKTTNIEIIHNNNGISNYNHTFKINNEYKFNYKAIINGNNNLNNINITGVTNGNVFMDIDGIISKNTKDNEVNENIKILTIDGKANIKPMLHVSTENCIVNHNTAISNINKDELFYLNSKGISNEKAIYLIENGYLYGLFKDKKEFLNMINNMGGDTIE